MTSVLHLRGYANFKRVEMHKERIKKFNKKMKGRKANHNVVAVVGSSNGLSGVSAVLMAARMNL